MFEMSELKPMEQHRVIDLVSRCRESTLAIGGTSGAVRRWPLKPKYRYEWSFVEPEKVVVLNLWYAICKSEMSPFSRPSIIAK